MTLSLGRLLPVFGGQTTAQILAAYIAGLTPLFWMDGTMNGAAIKNLGSLGATQDGTPTAITVDSNGMNFNATTSVIQVTRSGSMDGITKMGWAFMVRPTSVGENSSGVLYRYANTAAAGVLNNINRALDMSVAATGNARSLTDNNFLPAYNTVPYWVFLEYENDTDRLIRIYKGLSGAITEATYATQTAATGTLTPNNSTPLNIGNRSVGDNTYDGWMRQVIFLPRPFTPAEKLQLVVLSGLTA